MCKLAPVLFRTLFGGMSERFTRLRVTVTWAVARVVAIRTAADADLPAYRLHRCALTVCTTFDPTALVHIAAVTKPTKLTDAPAAVVIAHSVGATVHTNAGHICLATCTVPILFALATSLLQRRRPMTTTMGTALDTETWDRLVAQCTLPANVACARDVVRAVAMLTSRPCDGAWAAQAAWRGHTPVHSRDSNRSNCSQTQRAHSFCPASTVACG
jgi:hypothetical protein